MLLGFINIVSGRFWEVFGDYKNSFGKKLAILLLYKRHDKYLFDIKGTYQACLMKSLGQSPMINK